MQADNVMPYTLPTNIMQRDERPQMQENKTAQIGPTILQKMDSEAEMETILGSEEKLNRISSYEYAGHDLQQKILFNKEDKQKRKKCRCIAKASTIATGACATGLVISALSLATSYCVTGSHSLLWFFASTYLVGYPCIGAFAGSAAVWMYQEGGIDELKEENAKLKKTIDNINKPEYIAFIDSQKYENLEELLLLPDFHRYVKVCIKLKQEWAKQKADRTFIPERMENELDLREREDMLAMALIKKLDGNFKRFDFTH